MELQLEQQQIPCLIRIAHRSVEERVSADIVVPDSLPDAAKLLLTEGELCLWRLDLSDGSAELEGEIAARICFADEQGAPIGFPAHVPVRIRLRADAIETGQKPFLQCHIKGLAAQLLNSRKVRLQGTIFCSLSTYAPSEYTVTTGIAPEVYGLFYRKTARRIPYISSVEEQVFTADDKIMLQRGIPADGKLISHSSVPMVDSFECRDQNVVLKGKVFTTLLYEDAETAGLVEETAETPFSTLIEVSGDVSICSISLQFTSEEINCRYDEPALDTVFHLLAQVICYAEQEVECVSDAYSTRSELALNWKEQNLSFFTTQDPKQLWLEEEMSSGSTGKSICAARASCRGDSISLTVLLYDSDQKLTSVSNVLKTDSNPGEMTRTGQPDVKLGENGLLIRVPYFVREEITDQISMRVLSAAILEEEKAPQSSGITLIKREEEMDLWELAKSCRSSVDAIQAANPDQDRKGKWMIVPHVV